MQTFARIEQHAGRVLGVVALITALLVVPFLTMAPTESASTEPTGDVFTARDRVDESFVSSVKVAFFIVEHESGDLLRAEPLLALLEANAGLRSDPTVGPTLFTYFDVELGREVTGLATLAELIDAELATSGGLATAADNDVKAAGAALIERFGEASDLLNLSTQSSINADGDWVVPAISMPVLSDNDVLGFGNVSVNLGGGTEVEAYDRSVQELLRSADGFRVNGVAIDVNLTSQEQGAIAGPFIGFTILAVLLIVGLTFRSYWVLATVSVALIFLIIWLKGISNMLGLKDDLVLSLIVPIAMVSFGVDFAFHAIGRYREERAEGRTARVAFATGLTAVSGALVLALTSDAAAFLSNLTSGIESINQFGLGAGVALAAAFVLLGIVSPLVIARIEATVPSPAADRRSTALRVLGSLGVAGLTMVSVLLLVFILPWLGVLVSLVTLFVGLVLPLAMQRRKLGADQVAVGDVDISEGASPLAAPLGRAIAAVASRPKFVLPAAIALSAVAAVFAVRVPAEFDVDDFFAADTDFVVGLDQLETHVGERGGEPAILYLEGDLADPSRLAAVAETLDGLRSIETDVLSSDADGLRIDGGIFSVFDAVWDSPAMATIVQDQTGVGVTDVNGDRIPDTSEQIRAVIDVASQIGVPLDADRSLLIPDDVTSAVALGAEGEVSRTLFELALVDSQSQASVVAAREVLEPVAAAISDDLDGSFVQVTGSPFIREASLDATNNALQTSLPIALFLCLTVASVFLRSIRYGLASIVPIVMVIAWLYAFMEIAGYRINLVTATIAAVSVGIGIDFAIHFIARYREELARRGLRSEAVRVAGEGTGIALVASAFSSAVGFGILALAPMPLFAAYGLLTALMIVMALVATLLVLPSLLVVITSDASASELLALHADGGEDEPDAAEDADRTPELGAPSLGELVGERVSEGNRGDECGADLDLRVVADQANRLGAVGESCRNREQPDREWIDRGGPGGQTTE